MLLIGLKFWSSWPYCKTLLFGCSRSPDVDGIKIFDEDDWAAKHHSFLIKMTRPQTIVFSFKCLMFCVLVILSKINFDPINIRRPWAPEITMLCNEFMMIKTFNPTKSRSLWPLFSISRHFQQGLLTLGCSFLHLVFLEISVVTIWLVFEIRLQFIVITCNIESQLLVLAMIYL